MSAFVAIFMLCAGFFCLLQTVLAIWFAFKVQIWRKFACHNNNNAATTTATASSSFGQDSQQLPAPTRGCLFPIQLLCFACIVSSALVNLATVLYDEDEWEMMINEERNYAYLPSVWRVELAEYLTYIRAVLTTVDDILFMVLGVFVVTAVWEKGGFYTRAARIGFVWIVVVLTRVVIGAALVWAIHVSFHGDVVSIHKQIIVIRMAVVWKAVLLSTVLVAWIATKATPTTTTTTTTTTTMATTMSAQLSRSEWVGYGLYGWMLAVHVVVFVVMVGWGIWRNIRRRANDVFFTFVEQILLELTPFLVLSLVAYCWSRDELPQEQGLPYGGEQRFTAVAGDDDEDDEDDDGESGIQLT